MNLHYNVASCSGSPFSWHIGNGKSDPEAIFKNLPTIRTSCGWIPPSSLRRLAA